MLQHGNTCVSEDIILLYRNISSSIYTRRCKYAYKQGNKLIIINEVHCTINMRPDRVDCDIILLRLMRYILDFNGYIYLNFINIIYHNISNCLYRKRRRNCTAQIEIKF